MLKTLIRSSLFLFSISFSIVFFVSCQREVEEILEDSPPPVPDPSDKKLKAVYVLEDIGGWDTVDIFHYKYDDLGRLKTMELKSQTDSFYVRVSLFYQGADKYPYLVTDSSFENWSDPSIDSIFIFYNQGLVTYDSSILHGTNMFIWPLMPLEQVKTRRFTHVNNGLIQVSRKWTTLDDNGTVINTEETTGTISILQNNSNVFEQNYEEWVPGFPSSFDYYFKVTFSDFRNPLYGLMPDYPFVESDAYLPFGWEFPKFAAEIWNDRDGLSGGKHDFNC